ncbi:DUF5133 domain-containing protein [Streptomyces sp. NPDC020898]|uniref:DUF5133 domain-containing protein n=1 Tax=Streptomyces sp. NPDC020898 TaxID=3365101 RepID=UPI0037A0FBD0
MNDVCYTLCVATGTRDITAALTAARRRVRGHPPEDRCRQDRCRQGRRLSPERGDPVSARWRRAPPAEAAVRLGCCPSA